MAKTDSVAESFDCVLSAKGAEKAADFVEFCDAFEIPVADPYECRGLQGMQVHLKRSIAKAAAKLTYAFANATVPKVNVITGEALRQRIRCYEQQVYRSRYDIRMGKCTDRHDGCTACSQDHVRRRLPMMQYLINEKAAEYADPPVQRNGSSEERICR